MKWLVCLALLSFATAWAGDLAVIGVHVASRHFGRNADRFTNTNPGVYVRTHDGWQAGIYRNSLHHGSVYVGKVLARGRFSVLLGGVTGYPQRPLMPVVAPTVDLLEIQGTTLRLTFIQKVEKGGAGTLHLMLERPL